VQIDEFLHPRILIISGKGGVGKTTVSAALAVVAARQGRRVCIAEVDRKGTLPSLFGGGELGYEPREVSPGVWGMNIIPDEALAEYLNVQYHMRRVARIFSSTHFVDYITATAPGLKDILVLGKIWYLEQGRTGPHFDTIIVDAPAAGHMLTFLSAPSGLSDAVKVGPVQRQADWLIQMLQDENRTRVHLVTLAEEMPISETIETSQALKDRVKIETGCVFANAIYPPLFTRAQRELFDTIVEKGDYVGIRGAAAHVGLRLENEDVDALVNYARFREARRDIQTKHLRNLKKGLESPIAELPFLFAAGLDLPHLEMMADAIEERVGKL
jgi:anion-transporting  ArsA/GET3 family ATPase